MKPMTLGGILLVILGALALAYQGISYTRQEKVLDIGPIHATTETHERIPLPPILGGLALVGGVVLLVMGTRNKSSPGLKDRTSSVSRQGANGVKSMAGIPGQKLKGDFRCYC